MLKINKLLLLISLLVGLIITISTQYLPPIIHSNWITDERYISPIDCASCNTIGGEYTALKHESRGYPLAYAKVEYKRTQTLGTPIYTSETKIDVPVLIIDWVFCSLIVFFGLKPYFKKR